MSGIDRYRPPGGALVLALVLAWTSGPGAAFAQTRTELRCEQGVQGRIAWDYAGNRTWSPANLRRLCRGATDPNEPGRCFQRVMHGGISWGGGTRWQWENALDLCEGVADAERTIRCFQRRIGAREPWREAIRACTAAPSAIAVIQPRPDVAVRPDVLQQLPGPGTPPGGPGGGGSPGGGGAQQGSSRTILPDGSVEVTYPDGRRTRFYGGGQTTTFPDGTEQTLLYSTAARPPIPPAVPDTQETAWLEAHSERLLGLIKSLVGYDDAAVANYLEFEGAGAGVYERIAKREETLGLLVRD